MTETEDWIEWGGGFCPVSEDTIVDFKRVRDTEPDDVFRPGEYRAGDLRWTHRGSINDIVFYRVVKP